MVPIVKIAPMFPLMILSLCLFAFWARPVAAEDVAPDASPALVEIDGSGESSSWSGASSSLTEARKTLELIRKYRKSGFPHPNETNEAFTVGAQYRGAIQKSFPNLGMAGLECKKLGDHDFQVRLHAKVRHPEDENENIEFDVTRVFRLEGNRITLIREENQFNEVAAKHKKKILNTVSLAYLIKWRSPGSDSPPFPGQVYRIDDKTFSLTYDVEQAQDYWDTGRWMTARLTDGEGNNARFYLRRGYRGVRPLDKFRIYTKDKVVISFYING